MITITPLSKTLLQSEHRSLIETYSALVGSDTYTLDKLLIFFASIQKQGSQIFVAQCSKTNVLCGAITVLLEHKLIRGGVVAVHIEDLAVHKSFQGQGVGSLLLDHAIGFAKEAGAYKIILDCDEPLAGFYERKGFSNAGVFMKQYL